MLKRIVILALMVLLLMQTAAFAQSPIVFANRIPYQYFVTTGFGQSDVGRGDDHYETAAYDLALLKASIENYNVVTYTSVIPPESEQISKEDAKNFYHHGAVLETIMAYAKGAKGNTICAGVGRMTVYKRGEPETKIGGFAAEYIASKPSDKTTPALMEQEAKDALYLDLKDIFYRRYDPKIYTYDPHILTDVIAANVTNRYGAALAAICFVSYLYPYPPKPQ